MKISVITAVYNRHETIKGAIQSLQSQTHQDYEHVVIDGGITDSTIKIVKAGSDHRTNFTSEPDNGIYDAINKGIEQANGDVIGLLHFDGFFASDAVLAKIAAAFTDPSIQGVYGNLQYGSAKDYTRVIRHWKSGVFHPNKLAKGWMPPHPTLYLRHKIFRKWGKYDTSYSIAADYDALLRWLGRGNINLAYIPKVHVKMRIGGESNKSIKRIFQKSKEGYRAIKSNNVGGVGALLYKNIRKIKQFSLKFGEAND